MVTATELGTRTLEHSVLESLKKPKLCEFENQHIYDTITNPRQTNTRHDKD